MSSFNLDEGLGPKRLFLNWNPNIVRSSTLKEEFKVVKIEGTNYLHNGKRVYEVTKRTPSKVLGREIMNPELARRVLEYDNS